MKNLPKQPVEKWQLVTLCFALTLFGLTQYSHAAPITLVSEGKSTFSIVQPAVAPHSVVAAVQELQRSIAEATGAKLSLNNDGDNVRTPFISVGNTRQARAVGIDVTKIPDEGFRILTKDGNLYITGLDTTTIDLKRVSGRVEQEQLDVELHPEIPGPAFTKNGGYSNGTAHGVYTFLEDYLGVRWLMPGDIGRDVPSRSTLIVEDIDRTEAPLFSHRVMPILQRTPAIYEWRNRMKLGYSYRINHGHNWNDIVPPSMFDKHPDWYAMDASGRRVDPRGNRAAKLETTNPEVVKFVAAKAVEELKKHPEHNTFSLSPSDGLGYSQSPESRTLYDPAPPSGGRASVTPLILKFYRDVSAIVAKEHPQGKLSGYFYSDYSHPPRSGDKVLPNNFVPVLAGATAGGFGLYRPEVRELESSLLKQWEEVAPQDWFYFAFPSWLRIGSGMVTPAAPENVNWLFSQLVKNRIKGFHNFGQPDWSQAALSNYINAKMMWNPKQDARVLQREWLTRAYGAGAGAIMEEMYNKMDQSWFADFFRRPDSTRHNIGEAFFSRIYGAHYRDMEPYFLEAAKQPMTELQKQRFKLLQDNMRVLQWRLRKAGYLPAEYSSPLTINGKQVFELLAAEDNDFRRFFNIVDRYGIAPTPVDVQIGDVQPDSKTSIPNPHRILLYPTKDGEVRLRPSNISAGSSFLLYYIQGKGEGGIARGLLADGEEIVFNAKANTPYYLAIGSRGLSQNPKVNWELFIPSATPARSSFNGTLQHLQSTQANAPVPLLVYAPQPLNLNVAVVDGGVKIQPESTEQQQHQSARNALRSARAERQMALERYKGTVIQELDNQWRFITDPQKTGEQQGYFKPDYDYRSWKPITAVGAWQDHGFDYHGTAWYRKQFLLTHDEIEPTWLEDRKVLLHFGAIDGDAVIYLNGNQIGEHKMSDHVTGWEVPVVFDVTDKLVMGRNVLTVRVTKERRAAGLYRGVMLLAGVLPAR